MSGTGRAFLSCATEKRRGGGGGEKTRRRGEMWTCGGEHEGKKMREDALSSAGSLVSRDEQKFIQTFYCFFNNTSLFVSLFTWTRLR